MPLGDVLVHRAVPRVFPEGKEWVEGDADVEAVPGAGFRVLLQLPTAGSEETAPRGRRTIIQPQILYQPFDEDGGTVALSSEDEVDITAPELTGPDPVRWQVDGEPTPMAKPGHVIGYLARLKRVKD